MPTRALRPCLDCGTPSPTPRCPKHTRTNNNATHHRGRQRIYHSRQWREVRRRVLARDRWCKADGCTNLATDVDHIKPLGEGDDPYDETNLQPLCKRHHSQKTAREVWGLK